MFLYANLIIRFTVVKKENRRRLHDRNRTKTIAARVRRTYFKKEKFRNHQRFDGSAQGHVEQLRRAVRARTKYF